MRTIHECQHTISSIQQRRVRIVYTQPDSEHREDVENNDAEERRFDGTRNRFVRLLRFARCKSHDLHAAVRVKCEHEALCERLEAADESLTVLEVRETWTRMTDNTAPVVNKANDDEDHDEENLDESEPVFRLA